MRWIGLISYSLYLWHWPVITFWRIETGLELDPLETAMLVTVAIALATASYRFVEQPMLNRYRKADARPVLRVGVPAMVALGAAGLLVSFAAREIRPLPPEVERMAGFATYRDTAAYREQYRPGPCFRLPSMKDLRFDPAKCLKTEPGKKTMLILGDSHAAQYWRAFALRYPDRNVLQATSSSCPPVRRRDLEQRCQDLMDAALSPETLAKVDTVVIAARMSRKLIPQVVATASYLKSQGKDVVLLGPGIEYAGSFPSIVARSMLADDPAYIDGLRSRKDAELDHEMALAAKAAGIRYISVQKIESTPKWRILTEAGDPMHFDYGHLTLGGARWIVDRMPGI